MGIMDNIHQVCLDVEDEIISPGEGIDRIRNLIGVTRNYRLQYRDNVVSLEREIDNHEWEMIGTVDLVRREKNAETR